MNIKNNILNTKDNIFINLVIFLLIILVLSKIKIGLNHIIIVLLSLLIFYLYNNYNDNSDDLLFISNYLDNETNNYTDNELFIDFIIENKRFSKKDNYKDLIHIINKFLKIYDKQKNEFNITDIDILKDLSRNALNTYQSLIYRLKLIDKEFENNQKKLYEIFHKYMNNLNNSINENNKKYTSNNRIIEPDMTDGYDNLFKYNYF